MSFRAKVLVPVLVVMFLLLAVTIWVVDQRITRQMETEAKRTLATADGVFRNRQNSRTKELLLRFRILASVPLYKSAFQTRHPETVRDKLKDVLHETGVDIVMFTAYEEEEAVKHDPLFQKNDPFIPISGFESASAAAVRAAFRGEETVDTVRVIEKLYDVVSIPVIYGDPALVIGALTLGTEIGRPVAQEFSGVTGSRIVLLANGHVTASAVSTPEADETYAGCSRNSPPEQARRIVRRGSAKSSSVANTFFVPLDASPH